MRSLALAATAGVVLAGAAYLVHAVDRGVADAAVAPSETTARALRPPAPPPRALAVAPTAPPSPVADVDDRGDAPASEPPPLAETAAALDDTLATRFAADPLDPTWATPMEASLAAAFATPALAGSTIGGLACRGHMCRLEVDHADGAAQDRFFAAAGPTPAFRGAGAARPLLDPQHPDRHRTLIYLMREGQPLPTP